MVLVVKAAFVSLTCVNTDYVFCLRLKLSLMFSRGVRSRLADVSLVTLAGSKCTLLGHHGLMICNYLYETLSYFKFACKV